MNAAAGTLVWKYKTGSQLQSCPTTNPAGTVLYVGCYDGCMYAFNLDTGGDPLWRACTKGRVESSPVAFTTETGQAAVAVGSLDGTLYTFNAGTGGVLWKATLGKEVGSSAAVDR